MNTRGMDTESADTDYAPTAVVEHTPLAHELEAVTVELDDDEHQHDRRPLPLTLKMLLTAVTVAALGLGTFIVGQRQTTTVNVVAPPTTSAVAKPPAPQVPASIAPPPTIVTVTAQPSRVEATAPRAARSDADLRFLSLVSAIPLLITDPAVLTASGRSVCVELHSNRHTPAQIAAANVGTNGMTYTQTGGIVDAAITAYCPQYQGSNENTCGKSRTRPNANHHNISRDMQLSRC